MFFVFKTLSFTVLRPTDKISLGYTLCIRDRTSVSQWYFVPVKAPDVGLGRDR